MLVTIASARSASYAPQARGAIRARNTRAMIVLLDTWRHAHSIWTYGTNGQRRRGRRARANAAPVAGAFATTTLTRALNTVRPLPPCALRLIHVGDHVDVTLSFVITVNTEPFGSVHVTYKMECVSMCYFEVWDNGNYVDSFWQSDGQIKCALALPFIKGWFSSFV